MKQVQGRFQEALALHQRGQFDQARALYEQILELQPKHFDALHLLGVIAFHRGNSELAVRLIGEAIKLNANSAPAHNNLGNALRVLKRLDEAVASYDRAIRSRPDLAEAHNNRGVALQDLGHPDEALASCNRALEIKPDYAEAYSNRGMALKSLGRLDEALADYDRALAINPHFAEAHSNRGNLLRDLGRVGDALASYEHAIKVRPDFADAYSHRGVALNDLRRFDEALASYQRAIEFNPNHADAHWNLSICYLLLGNFTRGWREFEWRWRSTWLEETRRDFAQPLWLGGEALDGKTLLLHAEQGLGDTLQFCRYARLVSEMGARVILEVSASLCGLLTSLTGVERVVARGGMLPAFDRHCPLLSLPLAFGTDLGSIPTGVPYIRSDAVHVAAWQDRLGPQTKPRIGLAWSGSATHKNDRNRTIPLADMLPLLGDWAEWVSLQKDVREGDAATLASRPDIRHFGGELRDFADTAALIELLDLVVSVDTGVAHLAGAMGKPVWILLPFNPDWRWLLDRKDSPWYPTARLFRQPAMGDWESVLPAVREALQQV